jgi:hypothetical protein
MVSSRTIEWEAPDREERVHSPDWYWAVGIVALSITVAAILLENTLFAVLVIISTVVLFLRSLQKPQVVRYELTSRGFWVNKEFRPFTALDSFWIADLSPEPKLILKSKGLIAPLLIVPLMGTDPERVREFLEEFVVETELHEPLSRRVMDHLGF